MQYILTEEEKKALVPKILIQVEREKVKALVKAFRESEACKRLDDMGYCDNCPIAGINIGLTPYAELCHLENLSK